MTQPRRSAAADAPHPTEPRRAWYRAPGTLIGAATFTAVCAWLTFVAALTVRSIMMWMEGADPFEAFLLGLFAVLAIVLAGTVGLATLALTVTGAAATVPLAVVWFRDPHRSTGAGLAIVHAVVATAAMAASLVWLA